MVCCQEKRQQLKRLAKQVELLELQKKLATLKKRKVDMSSPTVASH